MVEIGTNSSDDFVAARDRLSGAMSPAELEALAGFAPWANPKPEMPYASSAAAEPAVAFLRDDEALNQPSGSERPPLTLVADNGEAQATAEDTRSDASALLSYILSLDEDIKKLLSGEIAALTSALQSGKSSGVDVGAIRLLIDAAKATSDASKAAESAEDKRKDAIKEIQRLSDDIKKNVDEIDPWLTPEERKRIKKAREEEEKAKEKLEWLEANGGTPEQKKAAEDEVVKAQIHTAKVSDEAGQGAAARNPENEPVNAKSKTISLDRQAIVEDAEEHLDQGYEKPNPAHVANAVNLPAANVVQSNVAVASSSESLADFAMNAPEAKPAAATQAENAAAVAASVTNASATESLADFAAGPVHAKTTALQVANATADQPTSKGVPKAVASNGQATPVMRG